MSVKFVHTIVGNPQTFRTEVEIFVRSQLVALVYETSEGWKTEYFDYGNGQKVDGLEAEIVKAQETLSRYVNRRGDNAPEGDSVAANSLWLFMEADGTAFGKKIVR